MLTLEHQANVFREPEGQHVLRVDGLVDADTAVDRFHLQRGLFALNAELDVVERKIDVMSTTADSLRFALEMPIPAQAAFYSAEILETATRLAARSRFRIERPQPDRGLYLSDILIAEAFPPGKLPGSRADAALAPKGSLVLPPGEPIGVYAEVSLGQDGPQSIAIELELIAVDGSPAVVRAARWIGQRLGLADRPAPQRLSWSAEIPSAAPAPIAVTLESGNLKPGRYLVELAVASAGRRVTSRREIFFSASATSSPRP
jgi:hypothetical protein